MRKRLITEVAKNEASEELGWMDLERIAEAEISSEDPQYPFEGAMQAAAKPAGRGWRAMEPGAQTLRLLFDVPLSIKRIHLSFAETQCARTQEYVLRWSADGGGVYRDIVRQQWNFNPDGAGAEIEDHQVNLDDVTALELHIVPDIGGGGAMATLERWRIA